MRVSTVKLLLTVYLRIKSSAKNDPNHLAFIRPLEFISHHISYVVHIRVYTITSLTTTKAVSHTN